MNNAPNGERDSAAVQEFLGNMETAFRAHTLWAGCSEEELESAGEVGFIFLYNFLVTFSNLLLKKGDMKILQKLVNVIYVIDCFQLIA